jgi:hypothetical protein
MLQIILNTGTGTEEKHTMWTDLVGLPPLWDGWAVLVGAHHLVHVLKAGIRRHL